jgi:hypothetical protein
MGRMSYAELAEAARGQMGSCKACPVCDGRACRNCIPGPGAKGTGTVAVRNYEAWQSVMLHMDTIHKPYEPDTSVTLFGRKLSLPVMVGPLGDVNRHYGPKYDMETYNDVMLRAAAGAGSLGWTGDGLAASLHEGACRAISGLDGCGICTIKPWSKDVVRDKLRIALAAHPVAVAMDIDGAGLPFLKGQQPPAGAKDVSQVREIAKACHAAGTPFVLKGIMTERGAEKAMKAGADGIVVSNHGGRVQDGVEATATVLPEISRAVGDDLVVLVDGGIRSGVDVFRAIALGANAVLMCRPFVVAMYGGGEQGVRDYLGQLKDELADAMEMCGAETVSDVTDDLVSW